MILVKQYVSSDGFRYSSEHYFVFGNLIFRSFDKEYIGVIENIEVVMKSNELNGEYLWM